MKKFMVMLLCAVFPLVFAKRAHAYIDPGTGSMLVQAALAAVAAASVSIGVFRRRIRSFFGRLFGRKKDKKDE
ncbi:MAG: hypothetical protein J7M30_10350 [Deltaproteobacteria bacterium]|nr:hypothetical protein [Deltaproteobacteria bacterium]